MIKEVDARLFAVVMDGPASPNKYKGCLVAYNGKRCFLLRDMDGFRGCEAAGVESVQIPDNCTQSELAREPGKAFD